MDKPAYPFDDFLADFNQVHDKAGLQAGEWINNVLKVNEYMKGRYSDPIDRQFRLQRFVLILDYLAHHVREFDQGDYAVYGSDKVGALVREHVLRAVHDVFTTRDVREMTIDPSPAEIMRLADAYRENDS